MKQFTFNQIKEGYRLAANARRLSPNTINDYFNTYRKFTDFLDDDLPFASISADQVEEFLSIQEVSKKTVSNYHTALSAMWTWATEEGLAPANILHKVKRARPEKKAIMPYSQLDIKAMLAVIGQTSSYTRPGKRESVHSLPQAVRTRAILFLLLDTGLRASELCSLHIHQLN
jgi:site-specific recombinase XerD